MNQKIANELVKVAESLTVRTKERFRMAGKSSIMGLKVYHELDEFVNSDEDVVFAMPFGGRFKEASFQIRKTAGGAIVLEAIWQKKPSFPVSYKATRKVFKLKSGFDDRKLLNLAMKAMDFILELAQRWDRASELYDEIESLEREDMERIEEIAGERGVETIYADMTIDDIEKVYKILEEIN